MPRLILISDTHGRHDQVVVPDGDILIHAGDTCSHSTLQELEAFEKWLEQLPHKHKFVIAGNHDFCFENDNANARKIIKSATYLQDNAVECLGLKIYGSPWQPRFFDWAFNVDRGEKLAAIWAKIPDDTDVLITHGPPFGILDKTTRGPNVGCEDLLERIKTIKPRLHVFGHIHEAYGVTKIGDTTHVNASICDIRYRAVNEAVVLEL